jgi:hypothetical protein
MSERRFRTIEEIEREFFPRKYAADREKRRTDAERIASGALRALRKRLRKR